MFFSCGFRYSYIDWEFGMSIRYTKKAFTTTRLGYTPWVGCRVTYSCSEFSKAAKPVHHFQLDIYDSIDSNSNSVPISWYGLMNYIYRPEISAPRKTKSCTLGVEYVLCCCVEVVECFVEFCVSRALIFFLSDIHHVLQLRYSSASWGAAGSDLASCHRANIMWQEEWQKL